MYLNSWAGPDSELGQAARILEAMYWKGQIWFIVAMILIVLLLILLVVTCWLGFSFSRLRELVYRSPDNMSVKEVKLHENAELGGSREDFVQHKTSVF